MIIFKCQLLIPRKTQSWLIRQGLDLLVLNLFLVLEPLNYSYSCCCFSLFLKLLSLLYSLLLISVAKVTKFADFAFDPVGRVAGKSMEKSFSYQKWVNSIDLKTLLECTGLVTLIKGQRKDSLLGSFAAKLTKGPDSSICLSVQKAECQLAHFSSSHVGTVEVLTDFSDCKTICCVICMKESSCLVQMFVLYRPSLAILALVTELTRTLLAPLPFLRENMYHRTSRTIVGRKMPVLPDQMNKSCNEPLE